MNSQTGEIDFMTDSAHLKDEFDKIPDTTCFDGNEFRVRLHGMNIRGGPEKFFYTETFTICTTFCNGTQPGFTENSALADVKVFPNPSVNGKVTVSNLRVATEITAYNILGQAVLSQKTDKPLVEIDLGTQPEGSYMLRIRNSQGTKMVKILKQ